MTDLIVDGNSLYARAWYATAKDFIDANMVLRSALQTVFSLINKDVDRIGATTASSSAGMASMAATRATGKSNQISITRRVTCCRSFSRT
jgi:hypothetical protein